MAPLPLLARGVSIRASAIDFLDAKGVPIATMPACGGALLIVANLAQRDDAPIPLMPESPAQKSAAEVLAEAERRLSRLLSDNLRSIVMDVAWDGGAERVRIRSDQFDMRTLGELAGPGLSGNLRVLIEATGRQAQTPLLDLGYEGQRFPGALRPPRRAREIGLRALPRDEAERAFEKYCRTLHLAWKEGLFEEGLFADATRGALHGTQSPHLRAGEALLLPIGLLAATPLPDQVAMSAALAPVAAAFDHGGMAGGGRGVAAAGGAPSEGASSEGAVGALEMAGEDAARMHRMSSEGADGGSGAPDRADIGRAAASGPVLLRRAPWHERALGRVRAWGPPSVVLPLVLAALGALAIAVAQPTPASARNAAALASLDAGLLALTHAFALFARKRRIENVPTSKVRSAAMGLCEIAGVARPLHALRTPFSQMPCVYYEYRLVARDPVVATDSSAGFGRLWTAALATRRARRARIESGNSGSVPFLVEDDTGSVTVDPEGAIVHVSTAQTLYNPPFAGGLVPHGTPVTAYEKYIPIGYPIYVLGALRQVIPTAAEAREEKAAAFRRLKADPCRLAACDLNGDGVIDDPEWETAREEIDRAWRAGRAGEDGRSDRLVIGRPPHGDLFFISEQSETRIVRRLAWRMWLALAGGGGLALWGVARLAAALAAR